MDKFLKGGRIVDVQRDRKDTDRITPVRINFHTAVTNAQHIDWQAKNRSQPYSHAYVGEHGQRTQYQLPDYRARADLDGNRSTYSIETWDGYGVKWIKGQRPIAWTDAQMDSLIAMSVELVQRFPSIPLRLARDSRPGATSHGFSWHRLGVDRGRSSLPGPWRVPGGLRYSLRVGKECPGDARIAQIPDILADVRDRLRVDTKVERKAASMRYIRGDSSVQSERDKVWLFNGSHRLWIETPFQKREMDKVLKSLGLPTDVITVSNYLLLNIPEAK